MSRNDEKMVKIVMEKINDIYNFETNITFYLNGHVKTHNGVMPIRFECNICIPSFSRART